jgi:hypothetical protein
MVSYNEDYVIMSEVLRKIDMDDNYHPSDRELKVVINLLKQEEKHPPKRSIRKHANLEW